MNANPKSFLDLIRYPILSEKSIRLLEQNQYSFAVSKKANKNAIKSAIESLFNVKVLSVNTCIQPLKKRRVGRYIGEKPQFKKAIVRLAPEDSITFFEKE